MEKSEENIPKLIEQLIRDLVPLAGDATTDESPEFFRILNASIQEQSTLDTLRSLDNALEAAGLGACSLSGEIRGEHDLKSVTLSALKGDKQQLRINKTQKNGSLYFFQLEGLASSLLQDSSFISRARKVRFAFFDSASGQPKDFPPFATAATWFLPWRVDKSSIANEWKGLVDPRKLVRDLTNQPGVLPSDIRPWLLKELEPPASSRVYETWKVAAANHLAYVLPLEITTSDAHGNKAVTVKGDRYRTIPVVSLSDSDSNWGTLFDELHACAKWVYETRQEADSKHTLLNYHLGLQWPDDTNWPDSLPLRKALSNARDAYRLHLLDSSKELLKSFTELRNSLHDEVNKVSENTRTLATTLWRDFAIAAGVVALQFVTGKDKLSPSGIRVLAIATSVFISISFLVTLGTNARFHRIARDSRKEWRDKLYSFINDKDFDDLVTQPITKGLRTYRFVALITALVYLVIVRYLLDGALF